MFGGAHELSIDSKGRLAVPAKFRDILSRLYTPAVVATLESKHKLLMYPVAEWEKVAAQLLNLKVADNPVLRRFQNLLLHNAEILEWDSAGRVLVPAGLRKRVDFDREVVLVAVPTVWSFGVASSGRLRWFRLWMTILTNLPSS